MSQLAKSFSRFAAWLLAASCLCANARQGVDPSVEFDLGVTAQNLHWAEKGDLKKQLDQVDALAAAGAKWVRLTLRKPFAPRLLAHIKRANQHGVKVLIHLEGGEPFLYPPDTKRRPGNYGKGGVAWDSFPLSELDLERSEGFVREFFAMLRAEKAHLSAIEMFNEINWNAFNGDLPLVEGGLWIDDTTPWNDPVFVQYRAGIEKIGQLTRIVSRLNRELLGGQAKIITSGQVGAFYTWKSNPQTAHWLARAQGALVCPALTLQLLQGSHPRQQGATNYLAFADGLGIHVYTQAKGDRLAEEIAMTFDPMRCVPEAGKTKPFWITESGYDKRRFPQDTDRLAKMVRFCHALNDYDRSRSDIAVLLFYNFSAAYSDAENSDAENYALWKNGQLLPAGRIFQTIDGKLPTRSAAQTPH